jgi:hypothetical protein
MLLLLLESPLFAEVKYLADNLNRSLLSALEKIVLTFEYDHLVLEKI